MSYKVIILLFSFIGLPLHAAATKKESLTKGAGLLPVVEYGGKRHVLMVICANKICADRDGHLATIGAAIKPKYSVYENALGAFTSKTNCLFSCDKGHGRKSKCKAKDKYSCACVCIDRACLANKIAPEVKASSEPVMASDMYDLYGTYFKLSEAKWKKLNTEPHESIAEHVLVPLRNVADAIALRNYSTLHGHDGRTHQLWEPTAELFSKNSERLEQYIDCYEPGVVIAARDRIAIARDCIVTALGMSDSE